MLFTESLFPEKFSRPGIETMSNARVSNREKVIIGEDGRWHIRDAFGRPPGNVSLGHIAAAAGVYSQNVMIGKSAGDVNQPCSFTVNGRGDKLLGWTVDHPLTLPIGGVVAGHAHVP